MSEHAELLEQLRGNRRKSYGSVATGIRAADAIEELEHSRDSWRDSAIEWMEKRDAAVADNAAFRSALNACHGTDMGSYYRVEPVEAWEYVAALARMESPGAAPLARLEQADVAQPVQETRQPASTLPVSP